MKDSIPIDLLNEVLKCINSVGVEQTAHAIRMTSVSNEAHKDVSDIIIETVCDQMGISKRALLSGTSRGLRTQSIMYVYVLHQAHLGYDFDQVRLLFSKKYDTVHNGIEKFRKLDPSHQYDEQVLRKYNEINEIVKQRIGK